MILLPNDCRCSPLKVNPSNWLTATKKEQKSLLEKDWYIYYRFYDPLRRSEYPKGKLVMIKGMNGFNDYAIRVQATQALIKDALDKLQLKGFNPILTKFIEPPKINYVLSPDTPFIEALKESSKRLTVEKKTKRDINNVVGHVETAARQLDFHELPIKEVGRRHLKLILEQCGNNSKRFTSNTFNHYRKYLSILFTELMEIEAIDANPVTSIAKKATVQKIRETLTDVERKRVNQHLVSRNPQFHRFLHIFFHSGARISELLLLKVKDVNLRKQQFKITVKKGRKGRETLRTIKDIALPLWKWLLLDGSPADYVFSKGLVPGPVPINPIQVSRRWRNQVMKPLKINATFYAAKHLHTTQVMDVLSAKEAAKHNEHNEGMVIKIYDTKREQRARDRVKGLKNGF